MDDQILVDLLSQGDDKAFRWLIDTYKNKVAATCYGYTGDRDAALDLAQDVFLEVYRSVANFRSEAKLSTWIYRISVNKSLNWVRDNKKHKQNRSIQRFYKDEKNPEIEIESQERNSGLISLMRQDDDKIIQEALNQLPENQKTAFILNKIDDMSYQKVAEIMEISISSVESLIFRARKNLQNKLGDYYKAQRS
ncbi:MAG: sigma-70 family RNA polymerase sigma factor [Bacteroidales bacterium]|nr:sigma-70 family RNA polymerase sigma factor [Bacteroidales bacterium]